MFQWQDMICLIFIHTEQNNILLRHAYFSNSAPLNSVFQIFMLIESLAEGGVRCGLPRDLALRLAAQTTLGSAAMLRAGGHPAALKDNVTSPAGSTAEGTYHLEQHGQLVCRYE